MLRERRKHEGGLLGDSKVGIEVGLPGTERDT